MSFRPLINLLIHFQFGVVQTTVAEDWVAEAQGVVVVVVVMMMMMVMMVMVFINTTTVCNIVQVFLGIMCVHVRLRREC